MTTTQNIETALQGIEATCQRLYAEAIAKGATDEQAIAAIKATILDYLKEG